MLGAGALGRFGLRPQGPCRVGTGESGLVLTEEGNPAGLSSCSARVAQGVSGPSSSCVWNPRVFADDARARESFFNASRGPSPLL